jgi:uncharacterized membrane protein
MEALIILLLVGIVVGVFVLPIVAIVKSSSTQSQLRRLQEQHDELLVQLHQLRRSLDSALDSSSPASTPAPSAQPPARPESSVPASPQATASPPPPAPSPEAANRPHRPALRRTFNPYDGATRGRCVGAPLSSAPTTEASGASARSDSGWIPADSPRNPQRSRV